MHTQAVEDYLKTIYELQQIKGKVATMALAKQLDVRPASVTGMVKKLADLNLVIYEPYKGVVLTASGEKIALEVIRHHRLIERYLAEALGVPWDQVDAEAEKWEHILSDDMEDRIDAYLGHPETDPHGAPIPTPDGHLPPPTGLPLSDLEPGQRALVKEVSDHDPELLRYLGELGLFPDVEVTVTEVAPFGGPVTVRINDRTHALGRKVAHHILVSDILP
jgi:DtxR family Mn-dependent transcriptional regulator